MTDLSVRHTPVHSQQANVADKTPSEGVDVISFSKKPNSNNVSVADSEHNNKVLAQEAASQDRVRFLGGYSSEKTAVLVELRKLELDNTKVENALAVGQKITARQSVERGNESALAAAKINQRHEIVKGSVTMASSIVGGVTVHQGHNLAIKGHETHGADIMRHRNMSNNLDAQSTFTRPVDMNNPSNAQDRTLLSQSPNRESSLMQEQQFQHQITQAASQQKVGVGQVIQGSAASMGTLASSPMIVEEAEQKNQERLAQVDKDVQMQESQRSSERASKAKSNMDLAADIEEKIKRSNNDANSAVANNMRM